MALRRVFTCASSAIVRSSCFSKFFPSTSYHTLCYGGVQYTSSLASIDSRLGFAISPLSARFSRDFSTVVAKEEESETLPTVVARKNPTGNITYDDAVNQRFKPGGDASRKAFVYFVLTGGRFVYASAIRLAVLKFVLSMSATKDVLALASAEVDLSNIAMGNTVTIKWRGKPVFIRRRTQVIVNKAFSVAYDSKSVVA